MKTITAFCILLPVVPTVRSSPEVAGPVIRREVWRDEDPITPGDQDRAITVERLTGASLRQIGRAPRVVWHFGVTRFRLDLGENPPDDLVRRLVGKPKSVTRIEGKWRLEETKHELVLYDLVGENFKLSSEVILPVFPAGLLRANVGGQQYSVNEFDIAGQWESVGDGPLISWTFTFEPLITRGNPFAVECNKGPLPKELTAKLLGHPTQVSRIEGEWKFNRFARRLELRKVTAGCNRQDKPLQLTVDLLDVLTISLLGGRYYRVDTK